MSRCRLAHVVGGFIVLAVLMVGGTSASAATAPGHFADARDDGGTAADLATVDVSDDGAGVMSIDVGFVPNEVLPVGDHVELDIDADQNVSTGDESGGDYRLVMFGVSGANPVGFAFFKWSGSEFVQVHADSLQVTWSLGHVVMKIAAADLGGATAIDFWVWSLHGDNPQRGDFDVAPEDGSWTYRLGGALTQTLTVRAQVGVVRARAGKTYSITFVISSVSGNPLTTLQLACQGSIRGKTIPGKAGFNGTATRGAATCYLKLPKSARRKTLEGVFDMTFEGVTTHNSFVVRLH